MPPKILSAKRGKTRIVDALCALTSLGVFTPYFHLTNGPKMFAIQNLFLADIHFIVIAKIALIILNVLGLLRNF